MIKTWFITGTSTGFGRELTELLLARGDRVAATVRNSDALADLQRAFADTLWVGLLDVADPAAIRACMAEAIAHFKTIDIVVSNAGYGLFGAAEEYSDAQIDRQIRTNLIGSIQVARAALPHFRANKRGHFLQISSMGGQVAFPALSVYHATKWGVEGFCEALAQEVASFGIHVTIVEPGGARTLWAGASGDFAEPIEAYAPTPAGKTRQGIQASGGRGAKGDPRRMAQAIIDCTDRDAPPLRLTLGSDALAAMQYKLAERLDALDKQKDIAILTDYPS